MAEFLIKVTKFLIPFLMYWGIFYQISRIIIPLFIIVIIYNTLTNSTSKDKSKSGWILPVSFVLLFMLFLTFNYLFIYFASSGGKFTQCQSNLKNISTAIKMYADDNEGRYPVTLSKLTPEYIKQIPICVSGMKDTYSSSYKAFNHKENHDLSRYTLYCKGTYHQLVGAPPDHPLINNEGLWAK